MTPRRVPPAQLRPGTSFALDVLRAVTAQAVVVGHALSFFHVLPRLQPPFVPPIQEVGVAIFFVLSGFLICFTTITRRASNPAYGFGAYFVDRLARIYSGLIPSLVFIAMADGAWVALRPESYPHHDTFGLVTGLGNVFMLETFPPLMILHRFVPQVPLIDRLGTGRPLWTLAIEWWIYMFFGWAVLRGQLRKTRPVLFWSVLALLSIVPLWNAVSGLGDGIVVGWVFGAIACAFMIRGISLTSSQVWWSLCAGCTALALGRAALVHARTWDGIFVALLSGAVVTAIFALQCSELRIADPFRRTARFIADYSFTLYLTHYTILEALVVLEPRLGRITGLITGIIAANVLAIAVAVPTEMRHRTLAKYLHRRFGTLACVRPARDS